MGIKDKCPFCSGKVNEDPVSDNWHTWRDMQHGVDFKVLKLPKVEYYELILRSTIVAENDEVDTCNIRILLQYCPVCGRKMTKTVDK